MPYYPKSQIRPNLYTNGGQYIIASTQQNYTGPYYELSNGRRYTGATPQDGPNLLLLETPSVFSTEDTGPISTADVNIEYVFPNVEPSINFSYTDQNKLPSRRLPIFNPTLSTQNDINLGAFQRYFCKKNNELMYLEVDQNDYEAIQNQDSNIAWDLYSSQAVMWYIKGNKETVYKANFGMVFVLERDEKWYGFSQYLKKDYLKYYVES
jgi:hypothetical protein